MPESHPEAWRLKIYQGFICVPCHVLNSEQERRIDVGSLGGHSFHIPLGIANDTDTLNQKIMPVRNRILRDFLIQYKVRVRCRVKYIIPYKLRVEIP